MKIIENTLYTEIQLCYFLKTQRIIVQYIYISKFTIFTHVEAFDSLGIQYCFI